MQGAQAPFRPNETATCFPNASTVPHHQAGCYSQIPCLYIDIKYHTCCSSRLLHTGWFYFIGIEKDPSPCISSNWLAATVYMRMSVDDVSAGTWWCSIMQICMHEETPSLPSQFMQLSELSSSEMLVATHARIILALQVQSAIDRVFYQSSTLSAEKGNGTLDSSIAIVYYPDIFVLWGDAPVHILPFDLHQARSWPMWIIALTGMILYILWSGYIFSCRTWPGN